MTAAALIDRGSGFWVAAPLLVALVVLAVGAALVSPLVDELIRRDKENHDA